MVIFDDDMLLGVFVDSSSGLVSALGRIYLNLFSFIYLDIAIFYYLIKLSMTSRTYPSSIFFVLLGFIDFLKMRPKSSPI